MKKNKRGDWKENYKTLRKILKGNNRKKNSRKCLNKAHSKDLDLVLSKIVDHKVEDRRNYLNFRNRVST